MKYIVYMYMLFLQLYCMMLILTKISKTNKQYFYSCAINFLVLDVRFSPVSV